MICRNRVRGRRPGGGTRPGSGADRRRGGVRRGLRAAVLTALLAPVGPAGAGDDWTSCLDERALERVSCPALDDRCTARCMVDVNIDLYLLPTFDLLDRFLGRDDEEARSWRTKLVGQLTFAGFLDAASHLSEEEIRDRVEQAGLGRRARAHLEPLLRAGLSGDRLALYRRFLLGEGIAVVPAPPEAPAAAGLAPRAGR